MNTNTNTRKIQLSLDKIADSINNIENILYSSIKNDAPEILIQKLLLYTIFNLIFSITTLILLCLYLYKITVPNLIYFVLLVFTYSISILIFVLSLYCRGFICIIYEVMSIQTLLYGIGYYLASMYKVALGLTLVLNISIWIVLTLFGVYIKEKVKTIYRIVEELAILRDAVKTFMYEYYSSNYKEKID